MQNVSPNWQLNCGQNDIHQNTHSIYQAKQIQNRITRTKKKFFFVIGLLAFLNINYILIARKHDKMLFPIIFQQKQQQQLFFCKCLVLIFKLIVD